MRQLWYNRTLYWRECKSIIQLGGPVTLTYFMELSLQLINMFVVGHLGAQQLAAAALGSMFCNCTGIAWGTGMVTAVGTLASHAYGAENFRRVGVVSLRGALFTTAAAIPMALLWIFSGEILLHLGQDAETVDLAKTYIHYMLIGLWPVLMFEVLKRFLQVQNQVLVPMFAALAAIICNATLAYFLVYHTSLGFFGAPIATCISEWLMFSSVIVYIYLKFDTVTAVHESYMQLENELNPIDENANVVDTKQSAFPKQNEDENHFASNTMHDASHHEANRIHGRRRSRNWSDASSFKDDLRSVSGIRNRANSYTYFTTPRAVGTSLPTALASVDTILHMEEQLFTSPEHKDGAQTCTRSSDGNNKQPSNGIHATNNAVIEQQTHPRQVGATSSTSTTHLLASPTPNQSYTTFSSGNNPQYDDKSENHSDPIIGYTWTGWHWAEAMDWQGWKEFAALALPGAAQVSLEWGAFEVLSLFAGLLGTDQLATHSVLGLTANVSFCVPLGISVACSVRIGRALTNTSYEENSVDNSAAPVENASLIKNDQLRIPIPTSRNTPAHIRAGHRTAFAGILLGWCYSIINVGVILALRNVWGKIFTSSHTVQQLVAETLPVMALFNFVDAQQCILAGILRGLGKQQAGAAFVFFCILVCRITSRLCACNSSSDRTSWTMVW